MTGPSEPITPVAEAAAGLHELFLALTAEGRFTKLEACVILGTVLAQGGSNGGHTDAAS